jgi:pimeloyl-ACP methyl ester carboxylesterase
MFERTGSRVAPEVTPSELQITTLEMEDGFGEFDRTNRTYGTHWLALVLVMLALGEGLATASAQRGSAPPRSAAPEAATAAGTSKTPSLERFTVTSDGHAMAVWARRPATPKATVLLVHGRTWSSRPDFDLQVPGLQRSVMQSLAAFGFAAYAVDLRGYGATPRDASGWLTPKRSVDDIMNVVGWITKQHPALPKPAIVGWSRGAALAALAASHEPTAARLSAIVMFGFAFDPDAEFIDITVPEKPLREKNTPDAAASDFISPKITPPAVVRAFVEQALRADPILMDLKNDAEFNGIRPEAITLPVLVIYGADDPGVLPADAGKMFAALKSGDKQIVSLPGADHAAQLEDTHDAWVAAVVNFLNRPRR